ncbi:Unknown protein sequence [Pseudomonas amygdali pv. lachrymans]|nr:Unknown protein sequence [Pseudomonas amygdali pv. lachrymans]
MKSEVIRRPVEAAALRHRGVLDVITLKLKANLMAVEARNIQGADIDNG